jgi:hydrogenase maturation protease
MKVLVLGLGNDLFRDDGVGLQAARALKAELELEKGASTELKLEVEVLESPLSGPAILDLLMGYDQAIIIDAIKTGEGSPGEIYELELDPAELELGRLEPSASLHYAGLPEALALAWSLGPDLPKRLKIYAVEAGELSLGEGLTERVAEALPKLLAEVRGEVERLSSVAATAEQA